MEEAKEGAIVEETTKAAEEQQYVLSRTIKSN